MIAAPHHHVAKACPFCETELLVDTCMNVDCFLFGNIVPLPIQRQFLNQLPEPLPIPPNNGRPLRLDDIDDPGLQSYEYRSSRVKAKLRRA